MKILQLCCFSNFWSPAHQITCVDLKLGSNIFSITPDTIKNYDIIISAPPCDQFTKANQHNWVIYPKSYVNIAKHCFNLSINSNKIWFLENPPGRIESFIPELKKFRLITFRFYDSNKEYVIYGNTLIMQPHIKRYSGNKPITNFSKRNRELWHPFLIHHIESFFQH